jgi:hypothetical protein
MKTERDKKLAAIWRHTHRDFKGVTNGVRYILVLRDGGTMSVPLDSLTDAENARKTPKMYAVVENSGYEGEKIVKDDFTDSTKAFKWVTNKYGLGEVERLHVQVALVKPDGQLTYDY